MEDFAMWLRETRDLQASSADWAALVDLVEPGVDNIDTFYELFSAFLSSRGLCLPVPTIDNFPAAWLGRGDT